MFFDLVRFIISEPYYTIPLEMDPELVTAVRRALQTVAPHRPGALQSLVARLRFFRGDQTLRARFVETVERLLPEESELIRELRQVVPATPQQ